MFWLFSLSLLVYLCFRVLAILAIGNLFWVAEMLFFHQNMFFFCCLMNTCAAFHLKILFPLGFFFFFLVSSLWALFSVEIIVPMPLIVFTNNSIPCVASASHKGWVEYSEFQLLFIFHPYCLYRLFLLSIILGRLFWTSDYCSHVNLPLWVLGHVGRVFWTSIFPDLTHLFGHMLPRGLFLPY